VAAGRGEAGFLEEGEDSTLQGNALKRARDEKLPTTLTAFEWEEWYAEHGVPEEHRVEDAKPAAGLWQKLLAWVGR